MASERRAVEFVYTSLFESTRKKLLSDEDLRELEIELLNDPERGVIEGGTGGVRKLRFALSGGGKSGGARVIYLYVPEYEIMYMLFAFPKSGKASLSTAEKSEMKKLTAVLKEERR